MLAGRNWWVVMVLLLGSPLPVSAWPTPYAGLAAGVSRQEIPAADNDGVAEKILTENLYAQGGVEWLPGISTGLAVYLWGDRNVNNRSDVLQFDGISAGWDATLRLPLEVLGLNPGSGPYWRYGRHCWAASATGTFDPWSQKGCSAMETWGINFPLPPYPELVIFLEYSQTGFRDIDSRSVLAGVQARF